MILTKAKKQKKFQNKTRRNQFHITTLNFYFLMAPYCHQCQSGSYLKGHSSQVFLQLTKNVEKSLNCILTKFEPSTSCRFQDIAIQS